MRGWVDACAHGLGEVSSRVGEDAPYHADRVAAAAQRAGGKADSLIILVRRKTDGRLEIDKLDFVRRLAATIAEEIVAADEAAFADIRRGRPLVAMDCRRAVNRSVTARTRGDVCSRRSCAMPICGGAVNVAAVWRETREYGRDRSRCGRCR